LGKDYKLAFIIQPGDIGGMLKPKDVVLIGSAHSGFVNSSGKMEHYLQPSGLKTTTLSPSQVLNASTKNFYQGSKAWTISDIRNYHYMLKEYDQEDLNKYTEYPNYPYKGEPIKVFRLKSDCDDLSGSWVGELKVTSVEGSASIEVGKSRLVRNDEFQVSQKGCDVSLTFNTNEIHGTVKENVAAFTQKIAGSVTEAKLTLKGDMVDVELTQKGNGITLVSSGQLKH